MYEAAHLVEALLDFGCSILSHRNQNYNILNHYLLEGACPYNIPRHPCYKQHQRSASGERTIRRHKRSHLGCIVTFYDRVTGTLEGDDDPHYVWCCWAAGRARWMPRFITRKTLEADRYGGVRITTQEGPDLAGGGWNRGNNGDSPTYDRRVAGEGQQIGYR